jgi:indole-3-glycerol phosphate synthase
MTDILETILATKRSEIAEISPNRRAEIVAATEFAAPARGFRNALVRSIGDRIRVIAEIKRASPSAGPIRPGADPAAIAREYAAAGASAISVLTDAKYFDGDLRFLRQAREAVPLPLLRKDFVIDPIQVAEARQAGADAVLLIVAAFPRGSAGLADCLAMAQRVGLDALVEVHDEGEFAIATAAGATLIGVNHRNLRTFSIDMSLTERISKLCGPRSDIVLVAESGIRTRDDVQRMADAGAHAILVGEQLMRAPSPGAALAELLS